MSGIQYLGDLDHSWGGSGEASARDRNNGRVAAKTAATMTYYERQDIPLQYEPADTFTPRGHGGGRRRPNPPHRPKGLARELRNGGQHGIMLRLRSLGYVVHEQQVRIAAGGAQPLQWPSDQGWYDVEITTPQDTTYRRRITGRAGNGARRHRLTAGELTGPSGGWRAASSVSGSRGTGSSASCASTSSGWSDTQRSPVGA